MRKANVMKKVLAGALALTTTLSLGLMTACGEDEPTDEEKENQAHSEFIDEIGGVSETYQGAVSQNNYSSANEAATSFVETEIVGEKEVEVVNTAKVADLNNDQIAALNIDTTGVVGVEEYEVEYSELEAVPYAATAAAPSNTKKVKVYIIKYENHWEYYSPCPVTGETITKSYYDSVFDADAYTNCTYSTSMDMDMTTTAAMQGITMDMTMDMTMTQTIKYSEGKIYMEQTTTSTLKMEMPSYPQFNQNETTSNSIYAYIEQVGDDIVCYAKVVENGEILLNWQSEYIYNIGFNSVEDLLPFADNYLDYTYFTKTDFGFQIDGEQAERYLQEALEELADYQSVIKDMDIKTIVKFYVKKGALSGMRQDLTIGYDGVMDGASTKLNMTLVAKGTVKDYGTTVVEKPAEIPANGGESAL